MSEVKYFVDLEQEGVKGDEVKKKCFLLFGFTEFGVGGNFLLGVNFLPNFMESFFGDELTIFNTAVGVIEGAVTVFYFLVELAKLPGEGFALVPHHMYLSDEFKVVTEFL